MKITFYITIAMAAIFAGCKKTKEVSTSTGTIKKDTIAVSQPANNLAPITAAGYAGYDLVWSDEFNGTTLDATKWNTEIGTGINGDFGTGQLDRATGRTDNLNIQKGIANTDGGSLAVTTRKEAYMDRQYTSGRINTQGKASFGPGYRIDARIWARDVRYKGQGFAFWLMPDEFPAAQGSIMWPQGGEIDVMEYVAAIP